jgi:hypothetical protein
MDLLFLLLTKKEPNELKPVAYEGYFDMLPRKFGFIFLGFLELQI